MAGLKSQFSKWLFALQVFKLSINPHRLVSRGWWLTRGPQTDWRMSRKRCLGVELGMLGDVRTYSMCSVKSVGLYRLQFGFSPFFKGLKITKQKCSP